MACSSSQDVGFQTMYFIRTRQAIKDLKAGRIDDREVLKYLFGLGLLSGVGLPAFISVKVNDSVLPGADLAVLIIGLVAFFIILHKCFRLNSEADSKRFLHRFLVLDFIVSLRLTLLFLVLSAPVYFAGFTLAMLEMREKGPAFVAKFLFMAEILVDPLLELILIIIWYFLLLSKFRLLTDDLRETQQITDADGKKVGDFT